jgi:hypothetical protein
VQANPEDVPAHLKEVRVLLEETSALLEEDFGPFKAHESETRGFAGRK